MAAAGFVEYNEASTGILVHNRQMKSQIVWTLAYTLLAFVGIVLVIPPGYASPIFPAAGFAVAIMLWFGKRAWPAILIGSFLLNAFLTRNSGVDPLPGIGAALLIGLGAAAQAYVAARLVQRFVQDEWRSMESVRSIFHTLLLAGPVACLISASNAHFFLYLFGLIGIDELIYSWWSWWVGDVLGVLVMLPICLALLGRHSAAWKDRIRTAFFPIFMVILMVASAFIGTSRLEQDHFRNEVREQGETFKHLLQQRFVAHQEAFAALRRQIEVTPQMTFDQFEYFTRITLTDNPDISALSVNAYVLAEEREDFERRMRQLLNLPGFHITQKRADGKLAPAADQRDYVVVQFISPQTDNAAAVGYDIGSEPIRREAIRAAIDSGKPAVTAPVRLVQGETDAPGLLVLHPAFRQSDEGQEPATLFAFAVGVLKIQDMIDTATARVQNPRLIYRVSTVDDDGIDAVVYQSAPSTANAGQDYATRFDLMMANRLWHIEVLPTQSYLQRIRSWTAWAVGVGGLLVVAMLQVLVLTITGQNSLIGRRVEEQTRELRAKTEVIVDRNAQLDAIFRCSPDGFIAFAEDGTVKYANPALLGMLDLHDERGMPVSALDRFLRERLEPGQQFSGIAAYFAAKDEEASVHVINLAKPAKRCLQIVGIHTGAQNIPRILYFRDVTQEFEIQKMKSDFLSHAAHELRTPMTTILGYTELLLSRDYDKPVRDDLLQTVQRQTNLIVTMINDLLDLARIEANRQPQMHFGSFDLTMLIRELAGELTFDRQRWPVSLALPPAPVHLHGDRQKVRQAIMNLIVNAQKYSPDGGPIVIKLEDMPEGHLLSIEDHGIGMTAEELTHVGEKFWRADTSGKSPGTGLGVAIVREIVQAHGGVLKFRSTPGQGTRVSILLPATAPSAAP